MNPIMNMFGNMMGGNGKMNPMQMIGQMMSGNMNPQAMVNMITQSNPQLKPVVQAFRQGNNQQAFAELQKINPQFAQMVQGKSPQQLQQMAGQAMQQNGINLPNGGMK